MSLLALLARESAAVDVPDPIAVWDWREASAPYYTTAGDLPLASRGLTAPTPVDDTPIGRALLLNGGEWLSILAADIGRLNLGAGSGTGATILAPVYTFSDGQAVVAGIWGETFDPPTRQYALFRDLPAYGGNDMTCFHISKNGGPTPGYVYSTDYSAEPDVSIVGRWEVHAGTYNGAEARSYMNGSRHDITGNTYTRSGDGRRNPYTFTLGLNDTPEDFVVGAIADGSSNWMGYIGKLQVWDQALTDAQVAAVASQWAPQLMTPAIQPTVNFHERRGASFADKLSHTETAMSIGTPSADRLVVAVIDGGWGVPRALSSVTIGGISATILQSTSPLRSNAWAYAIVPTGTTADVVATWAKVIWKTVFATFTIDGSAKTPSAWAVSPVNSKGLRVPASATGSAVLAYSGATGLPHTWGGLSTKLFEGYDPQGVNSSSASVMAGIGLPLAVRFTNGVGTSGGGISAIAFDPA